MRPGEEEENDVSARNNNSRLAFTADDQSGQHNGRQRELEGEDKSEKE